MWHKYLTMYCEDKLAPDRQLLNTFRVAAKFYLFLSEGMKFYFDPVRKFNCPCRYENPEIALNCGAMLRECIRHETLARIILYSPEFYKFFDYVEVSTFDISSDAFATFKVIRY